MATNDDRPLRPDMTRWVGADRSNEEDRKWANGALRTIAAESQRSADTHLIQFPLHGSVGVDLYLKDESTHVTGSLKHRLARSLFTYALCNGWLHEGTTIVEASSGSTAVSEAYFARLIGLPFVAVMSATTSPEKIALIRAQGGQSHLVDDPAAVYEEARRIARDRGGHYLDQFTYAERATDWRGNNNIAESIFNQLTRERFAIPEWIVMAAGTGGTSATIGRYIRYLGYPTRLCVPDPENSVFFESWRSPGGSPSSPGSRIEGIGRPRVEPSFTPGVVDRMMIIPDEWSVAAMREAELTLRRRVGPSTGTNLCAAFSLAAEMREQGRTGSIVTTLCDSGDRYQDTYYDDAWVAGQGWDLSGPRSAIGRFLSESTWPTISWSSAPPGWQCPAAPSTPGRREIDGRSTVWTG